MPEWENCGTERVTNDLGFNYKIGLAAAQLQVQDWVVRGQEDALTATDSLQMLVLAESCSWAYGDAVYGARTLFAQFDPERTFDGDYCGTAIQPLRQQPASNATPMEVVLYPNPAGAFLLVTLDRPFSPMLPCRVYDVAGKQVPTVWLAGEGNTLLVETDQLPAGIYVVEVTAADGTSTSRKFTKQ